MKRGNLQTQSPSKSARLSQLNSALHIIAITRANHDPATKAYLARKQAEGKTKKGALRLVRSPVAR